MLKHIGLAVFGGLLLGGGPALWGQAEYFPRPAHVDVAFDYSYVRGNAGPGQCNCFGLSGGGGELALPFSHHLSGVVEVSGEHTGTTSIPGQALSLLLFTAGPRFTPTVRGSDRFLPFVQGLVGGAHGFSGQFPTAGGSLVSSHTSFALLVGGGLDVRLGRRLSFRAVEADYGLTQLPNGVNDRQNLLRLSSGVTFRIR